MTNPCDLNATHARQLIGAGELSPVELLESGLARIEDINGSINAITAMDVPRARLEAIAAEKAVRNGDDLPALHGLPVGITFAPSLFSAAMHTSFHALASISDVHIQPTPAVPRRATIPRNEQAASLLIIGVPGTNRREPYGRQ